MDSVPSDRQCLPGFPIRKSADQRLFAAPHSLSQLITPFIACPCQGIHHEPYQCLTPTILHVPRQKYPCRGCANVRVMHYVFTLALSCSADSVRHIKLCGIHCTVQCGSTYHYVKRTVPHKYFCQGVVELVGFEPTASCLQSRCSTN